MNTILTELKIGIFTSMATYALLIKMYDGKKMIEKRVLFLFYQKKKMKITLASLPFKPVRYQSKNNINSPIHNL